MFLIYHVTSRDHVLKGLCDLMGEPVRHEVSHTKSPFCGHRPCGSSDTAAKIVYMTLQDHVIKGFDDFMGRNSSLYIPTLSKLITINIVLMDV